MQWRPGSDVPNRSAIDARGSPRDATPGRRRRVAYLSQDTSPKQSLRYPVRYLFIFKRSGHAEYCRHANDLNCFRNGTQLDTTPQASCRYLCSAVDSCPLPSSAYTLSILKTFWNEIATASWCNTRHITAMHLHNTDRGLGNKAVVHHLCKFRCIQDLITIFSLTLSYVMYDCEFLRRWHELAMMLRGRSC